MKLSFLIVKFVPWQVLAKATFLETLLVRSCEGARLYFKHRLQISFFGLEGLPSPHSLSQGMAV